MITGKAHQVATQKNDYWRCSSTLFDCADGGAPYGAQSGAAPTYQSYASPPKIGAGTGGGSTGTCFKCGEAGHWARDCPGTDWRTPDTIRNLTVVYTHCVRLAYVAMCVFPFVCLACKQLASLWLSMLQSGSDCPDALLYKQRSFNAHDTVMTGNILQQQKPHAMSASCKQTWSNDINTKQQ